MKAEIHPNYHADAKIVCACGSTMTVGSTQPEISIELCSACHPFYTGKQKLVDTAGRVEKFKNRVVAKDGLTERVGKRVKKERETAKKQQKAAAEA